MATEDKPTSNIVSLEEMKKVFETAEVEPGPEVRREAVTKLNEEYAVIIVGGKAAILHIKSRDEYELLSVEAFKTWLKNKTILVEGNTKGSVKDIPLAEFWLKNSNRRQYEGMVFVPNRKPPKMYNLWQGFTYEPKEGDCSKFLDHIKYNICQGNVALNRWVIGWFADIVQHPDKKCGTSLVIRGKQGVGKTIVGEIIGKLLGPHYTLVADPRYITGRFNSHISACLLLHADEAFWAGDHSAEGKLKDLITGYKQPIEFKGRESIFVDNFVRLLVIGNQGWLVPAGLEERRFGVLDAGDAKRGDTAYFAALIDQMEHGGYEAEVQFGRFLRDYVPGLKRREGKIIQPDDDPKYGYVYEFPPLAKCREEFDKLIHQSVPWNDCPMWQERPTAIRVRDEDCPF